MYKIDVQDVCRLLDVYMVYICNVPIMGKLYILFIYFFFGFLFLLLFEQLDFLYCVRDLSRLL